MTLQNVINDTRIILNDTSESVWTTSMIISFINEGILDIKSSIPEYFTDLNEVSNVSDVIGIDNIYKRLISIFTASRCFFLDEQYYKSTELRNDYEQRKQNAIDKILESDEYVTKINEDGSTSTEVVKDVYFDNESNDVIGVM